MVVSLSVGMIMVIVVPPALSITVVHVLAAAIVWVVPFTTIVVVVSPCETSGVELEIWDETLEVDELESLELEFKLGWSDDCDPLSLEGKLSNFDFETSELIDSLKTEEEIPWIVEDIDDLSGSSPDVLTASLIVVHVLASAMVFVKVVPFTTVVETDSSIELWLVLWELSIDVILSEFVTELSNGTKLELLLNNKLELLLSDKIAEAVARTDDNISEFENEFDE